MGCKNLLAQLAIMIGFTVLPSKYRAIGKYFSLIKHRYCECFLAVYIISLRLVIDKGKVFRECVLTQIKRAYEMHIGATA